MAEMASSTDEAGDVAWLKITPAERIEVAGWRVQSQKAPISGDDFLEALKDRLQHSLSLPEQLFGGNSLRLIHVQSGATFSFTADAALQAWKQAGLPPVRVGSASKWQQQRQQDIVSNSAAKLEYDWTFTTPYEGTTEAQTSAQDSETQRPSAAQPEWQGSTDAIDKGLLMARDPILFYDEVPLYESELDDNGVASLSVKVRVMPRCWFVLLRFWLRVDKVLVRLRDTRICCPFPAQGGSQSQQTCCLTRETTWYEAAYEDLLKGKAAGSTAAFADADSTAVALQSAAPTPVVHYHISKLQF